MRHRLRRWSTIAFLAIFGLAFAPTISHALAQATGDAALDSVCTANDIATAAAAGAVPAEGNLATALNHLSHCPLCGLMAQALAVPVALPPLAPPVALGRAHPARSWHAPAAFPAWPQAQPRAPPRLG